MIDALAMGKAIISPTTVFSEDLVKKTSVLLYNDIPSFYDACSVIIENKDFRNILELHNYEYGQTLSYPKIAQQYINQIKRFKFN
jgi:folate-dependent tRNA-U54 methylase TrmFO/GidA